MLVEAVADGFALFEERRKGRGKEPPNRDKKGFLAALDEFFEVKS